MDSGGIVSFFGPPVAVDFMVLQYRLKGCYLLSRWYGDSGLKFMISQNQVPQDGKEIAGRRERKQTSMDSTRPHDPLVDQNCISIERRTDTVRTRTWDTLTDHRCMPRLAILSRRRSNTALTSLNLSGNRLPALEIERIAAGLSEHPSLSSLTLSGETVNDSAARDIGRLAAPGRLLSLDLARSALEGVGAVSVARALNTASGLTYLDLSDNVLGVAAAREIANALQNGTGFGVRLLRLVRCGLGPVGGAVVATALGRNRSVEELDLSDNGLGEAAGMALSRSLRVLYRNGEAVS